MEEGFLLTLPFEVVSVSMFVLCCCCCCFWCLDLCLTPFLRKHSLLNFFFARELLEAQNSTSVARKIGLPLFSDSVCLTMFLMSDKSVFLEKKPHSFEGKSCVIFHTIGMLYRNIEKLEKRVFFVHWRFWTSVLLFIKVNFLDKNQ